MLITEYRIPLPLTVQEYQLGQLYTTIQMSKNETGGGEGVEVLTNEPFKDLLLQPSSSPTNGQYTYKIYHFAKKIPSFIKHLAPNGSLELHEEAWNAYPYCKTELRNPGYMKEDFSINVYTVHCNDKGDQENVHALSPDLLDKRHIVYLDIVNDGIVETIDRSTNDPTQFTSTATGRGPFVGNWVETTQPIMTCYKLVMTEFKWFGLQTRIEKLIQKTERKLFVLFHRMLVCSMDKWYTMSINEIREIEKEGAVELHKKRQEGTVQGLVVQE